VLYAILGTSRDLSVGPTSIAAIMVAAAIAGAGAGIDPVAAALILAALSGMILLAMGVLRLGVFANLLSQPVLTGFLQRRRHRHHGRPAQALRRHRAAHRPAATRDACLPRRARRS
jgi:hypothetical protein